MTISTILIIIFIAIGIFYTLVGVIGILKLPEFFSRLQASTCITTLGAIGACAAGLVYAISNHLAPVVIVKVIIIMLLIMITSAISGHSLMRGDYRRGHRPGPDGFAKDDYKEDGHDKC